MNKMIIFDMDGTIADLYGVNNWLDMVRSENPEPYLIAEPMVNMVELIEQLTELKMFGWKIVITSWLAMNSSKRYKNIVRQAKKEWLAEMGFPYDELHLVQYGTPKQKCTKSDISILFDDSDSVRQSFNNPPKGRYVVNPQTDDIIETLEIIKNFF